MTEEKKRGYKFLTFVVAVAVIYLVGFNLLSDWLNETYNMSPAMANIAKALNALRIT